MKTKILLPLLAACLILFSCKKETNSQGQGNYFISFTLNGKDTIVSSSSCSVNYGQDVQYYSVSSPSVLNFNTIDIEFKVDDDSLGLKEFSALLNKKLQLNSCRGCGEAAGISLSENSQTLFTDDTSNPLPAYYLMITSIAFDHSENDSVLGTTNFYKITGEFHAKIDDGAGGKELTNGKFRLLFAGVSPG
ncbi:MAG TPA: hypothetical protein VKT28_11595 [Puia sp.]|nr:hypothetical protein [Puia sp.]